MSHARCCCVSDGTGPFFCSTINDFLKALCAVDVDMSLGGQHVPSAANQWPLSAQFHPEIACGLYNFEIESVILPSSFRFDLRQFQPIIFGVVKIIYKQVPPGTPPFPFCTNDRNIPDRVILTFDLQVTNPGISFACLEDGVTIGLFTLGIGIVQTNLDMPQYFSGDRGFSAMRWFSDNDFDYGRPFSETQTTDITIGFPGTTAKVTPVFGNCNEQPETDGFVYAEKCNDETVKIVVDLFSNDGPQGYVEYLGDRYTVTGNRAAGPPVAVQWVNQKCDVVVPPEPDFAIATICPSSALTGATVGAPSTIVYAVNPAIGAGFGGVSFTAQYPNPACPDGESLCSTILRYNATATPATGPGVGLHLAGSSCATLPRTLCLACPGVGSPTLTAPLSSPTASSTETMTERNNRLLREQGFDPTQEVAMIRRGGCCDPPLA